MKPPITIKSEISFQSDVFMNCPDSIDFEFSADMIVNIQHALLLLKTEDYIHSIEVNPYYLDYSFPHQGFPNQSFRVGSIAFVISKYSVVVSVFEKFNGSVAEYDVSQILTHVEDIV